MFNSITRTAGYFGIRKPEAVSIARSRSFNKTNVDDFFIKYEEVMKENNFPPHLIFNMDEKGISTVPNHPPKIVRRKVKSR